MDQVFAEVQEALEQTAAKSSVIIRKSTAELDVMQQAGAIVADAHALLGSTSVQGHDAELDRLVEVHPLARRSPDLGYPGRTRIRHRSARR